MVLGHLVEGPDEPALNLLEALRGVELGLHGDQLLERAGNSVADLGQLVGRGPVIAQHAGLQRHHTVVLQHHFLLQVHVPERGGGEAGVDRSAKLQELLHVPVFDVLK